MSERAHGWPLGRMTPHWRSTSTGPTEVSNAPYSPANGCHTFGLGHFGFGLIFLLLGLGRLFRLAISFALLAFGVFELLAGALAALFIVGVVAAFVIVLVFRLARLFLARSLLGALTRLPRLLLSLSFLLLHLEARCNVRLGGRFQDALLAVLALLQVGQVFEGAAGRKGLAGIVVELVDDRTGGGGRGGGGAGALLLLVYCVLVVRRVSWGCGHTLDDATVSPVAGLVVFGRCFF